MLRNKTQKKKIKKKSISPWRPDGRKDQIYECCGDNPAGFLEATQHCENKEHEVIKSSVITDISNFIYML